MAQKSLADSYISSIIINSIIHKVSSIIDIENPEQIDEIINYILHFRTLYSLSASDFNQVLHNVLTAIDEKIEEYEKDVKEQDGELKEEFNRQIVFFRKIRDEVESTIIPEEMLDLVMSSEDEENTLIVPVNLNGDIKDKIPDDKLGEILELLRIPKNNKSLSEALTNSEKAKFFNAGNKATRGCIELKAFKVRVIIKRINILGKRNCFVVVAICDKRSNGNPREFINRIKDRNKIIRKEEQRLMRMSKDKLEDYFTTHSVDSLIKFIEGRMPRTGPISPGD